MFQAGDMLLKNGELFQVEEVTTKRISDSETETIIHYAPVDPVSRHRSLKCSLPLSSIDKANIRKPISKDELTELFGAMGSLDDESKLPRSFSELSKELNDFAKMLEIVGILYSKQQQSEDSLPYSKKDMLEKISHNLALELGHVLGKDTPKAQQHLFIQIEQHLGL